VGGSSSNLALVARGEFSKVTVVITLPILESVAGYWTSSWMMNSNAHLEVKDLGLSSLGLGDKGLVEHVKDILANLLQLGLDLLTIIADNGNVLIRTLGFLLLLDGGDDTPRGTASTDDVLVGDG
jgi:hypothetical protein